MSLLLEVYNLKKSSVKVVEFSFYVYVGKVKLLVFKFVKPPFIYMRYLSTARK